MVSTDIVSFLTDIVCFVTFLLSAQYSQYSLRNKKTKTNYKKQNYGKNHWY